MDSTIRHRKIEEAVGRYELVIKKQPRHVSRPGRLITLSRQIGAGGREIALEIGNKLGCLVWGREILDVLASQAGGHYQARMFEALDESTQGAIDELVSDFFGRVGQHTYHYLLPRAIFTIAQSDAVFLGRGANLLLPQAFHVRITASRDKRIQALMQRETLSRKAAEHRVRESDQQREGFLKDFCRTMLKKDCHNDFDLIVNTDRISCCDGAAIIMKGFELFVKSKNGEQKMQVAV